MRIVLAGVLITLSASAWGDKDVQRIAYWGSPSEFTTTASEVRIVDENASLGLWVNESHGGSVDTKHKKVQVPVRLPSGGFATGNQKVRDVFKIKPKWKGDEKSHVVTARISGMPSAGGKPFGREFKITFRR